MFTVSVASCLVADMLAIASALTYLTLTITELLTGESVDDGLIVLKVAMITLAVLNYFRIRI